MESDNIQILPEAEEFLEYLPAQSVIFVCLGQLFALTEAKDCPGQIKKRSQADVSFPDFTRHFFFL